MSFSHDKPLYDRVDEHGVQGVGSPAVIDAMKIFGSWEGDAKNMGERFALSALLDVGFYIALGSYRPSWVWYQKAIVAGVAQYAVDRFVLDKILFGDQ